MTNEAFIEQNRDADIRSLALSKIPAGIDLHFCLQQIEGLQIAQKKLPAWAKTEGILFPPKVSLEQCSSEQTALYKQQLVERLLPMKRAKMVDLTGGFGIDFSYLAKLFDEANYVERDEHLCEIAQHNFPLLGLQQAKVHCSTSEDYLDGMGHFDIIYLDPSRRDAVGRKVVALNDCSPNVEAVHDEFECKEVLLVLCREKQVATVHCVNLSAQEQTFSTTIQNAEPVIATHLERYLYEPNASILKAGVQNSLCQKYDVRKLHSFSHLFISAHFIEDFPGRSFEIEDACSFAKKDLKRMLADITQCNLTVRNFPATVAELRKRLKLREGGDIYLFATTLADGSHALIRCKRL